jgi:glyoxylase-like metal-dependent hydrolase (beta-lactamase superfamily II)
MSVTTHGQGADPRDVIVIDTMTAGVSGVTAGYLLPTARPVLVECGPSLTIEATIEALRSLGMGPEDLAFLVVTHVHLDHAGGAGDLLEAFPRAKVVVSTRGARHLNDPERLNASAKQVYGSMFDTVYGPCTPIDAQRIIAAEHEQVLELGAGRRLILLDSPGHAKHHLSVFDPDLGALFSGDSVGVRLAGMETLRPATPPADFNYETMCATLGLYRERAPQHLYLAHFGAIGPAAEALDDAEQRLRDWVEVAERAWRGTPPHEDEIDHVARMLEQRFTRPAEVETDADVDGGAPRTPPIVEEMMNNARSNAAGILRYLQRRESGTLTRLG